MRSVVCVRPHPGKSDYAAGSFTILYKQPDDDADAEPEATYVYDPIGLRNKKNIEFKFESTTVVPNAYTTINPITSPIDTFVDGRTRMFVPNRLEYPVKTLVTGFGTLPAHLISESHGTIYIYSKKDSGFNQWGFNEE